ncbi:MAG: trypsin-like peptidase domain-containing protein [Peptococcaceae bacterium]|jgi:serine protease Do|nr:trypsin-like peptidase domain-containing protein [Peptococcaceae bacterium]
MSWNPSGGEPYFRQPLRRSRFYGLKNFLKTVLLIVISAFLGGWFALKMAAPAPEPEPPASFQDPGSNVIQSSDAPPETAASSSWPVVAIAETVGPAVVGISNISEVQFLFGGRQEVEQGSGSGVIISENGYIVTNQHVIDGAQRILVSLSDGRQLEATLQGQDADSDLAVLKVEDGRYPTVTLGDSDQVRVGELAVAIGNPLGNEFARSVTVGVISAKDRQVSIDEKKMTLLQTDAAINPGNSGGALVNAAGRLIGINSAKLTGNVEGMGFAIPINDAKPIIDELIQKGYISKPSLGIIGYAIDARLSARTGLPQGIFIQQVSSGEATSAGLRANDVIVLIEDRLIDNSTDLKEFLNTCKIGDSIRLRINRDGREADITLNLIERKE